MRSDKPYRRGWCTECLNAWQRDRRAIHNAEAEAWRARTRHGAKGGAAAAARGDWLRNMAPAAKARYIRDANLKALYGISLPEYEELLQMQGGVCAICTRPPRGKRPLDVDHDHESGKVRGLLCGNCNRAIGLLDENPRLFDRAKEYLAQFK
ncbi:MAG TPA: endonuclease VII domain-containing protein [Actinomycetes bacterium]|nr:endonuclease VII domain-containing protein [Actinomycetes bacterium]